MVILEPHKEILVMPSAEALSLREERRRTGRYMAAGAAIFLTLLGVYQAVARGTPEYAALFAPALIMFIYILWILYVSRNQRRAMDVENSALAEKIPDWNIMCPNQVVEIEKIEKDNTKKEKRHTFNRSYSIA